jgi:hypothetical protein
MSQLGQVRAKKATSGFVRCSSDNRRKRDQAALIHRARSGHCPRRMRRSKWGDKIHGDYAWSAELTYVVKRLRLLHELVPKAVRFAVLVNPANAAVAENTVRDAQQAAPALALQIQVYNASTIPEIDAAFAALSREHVDALFVAADAFFVSRRGQFATLTARDRIPATYPSHDFAAGGGADELRSRHIGNVSWSRGLYRQGPARSEAR